MTAKDKRYVAGVEKALATFDSLVEWADYIAFLLRLQKALALGEEQPKSAAWIPHPQQVAQKLLACLSPRLPNGVHQKTLALYGLIFQAISDKYFSQTVHLWLPGLLPLVSYGSMLVKPEVLLLYKTHVLPRSGGALKSVCKPLMLLLLSGIDDVNSEVYSDAFALLDQLKDRLTDNLHFWHCVFLCVITSPERRLGALNWLNLRLPVLSELSAEAQYCLDPEPGLLIRAFTAALDTKTSFNPATDIVVIRGFFDLLLSHLPLSSPILQSRVAPADREILLMACLNITLRRDMSLNRRLWLWLLGPEDDSELKDKSQQYFANYALPVISEGVLSLVNSEDPSTKVHGFRLCLSLIVDRWEISRLATPRLFVPVLQSCYASAGDKEVLLACKAFFDAVEACYIWDYIICNLVLSGTASNFDMLSFLLKNFDFHDQELANHIPLAILAVLLSSDLSGNSVHMLRLLLDLAQPKLFSPVSELASKTDVRPDSLVDSIKTYYKNLYLAPETALPIEGPVLSFVILDSLKNWYVSSVEQGLLLSTQLSSILCDFLFTIPTDGDINPFKDLAILDTILAIEPFAFSSDEQTNQKNLLTLFGVVNLTRYFVKNASFAQRNKLLKIVLSNLWYALVNPYPANNEMEAVKCIFDFELSFDVHHVEAGILELLLATPREHRVSAFHKLWAHSSDYSIAETLLAGPLHLVLDDLFDESDSTVMTAQKLVYNIIAEGSAGRLLKLATNPLLGFDFMKFEKTHVTRLDDLKIFCYHLRTIHNIVKCNEKLLKETMNHEFVVSESAEKILLIKSNNWDISTYKSLILAILHKFLNLKPAAGLPKETLKDFVDCCTAALDLFSLLVVGSEVDFESHLQRLIEYCSYYTSWEEKPLEVESVEAQYIKSITHFLNLANSMHVSLDLLQKSGDKEPLLITFIVQGISGCQTSIVMEKWFSLLTKSLYLFNELVFSVVLTLNDAIIHKVKAYFASAKAFSKSDNTADLESSFAILLTGLEDLLSISHSYLLTSSLRKHNPAQANNDGFLGNMILGVFQIESPDVRTDEQNRFYSVLLSIQDTARLAFDIWVWADTTRVEAGEFVSPKTATYFEHKLRFRSRKLLESMMDLERQEVIETIIEHKCETHLKVKILHILDGGRSQVTFPRLINLILSRYYPLAVDEKSRALLNSHVTGKQLSSFLVPYLESVDQDVVDEMWGIAGLFFREVLAHSSHFRELLASYLVVLKVFSAKIGDKRGKNKKELVEYFSRMVGACSILDEPAELDELFKVLTGLVENLGEITQDSDKASSVVTQIISHVKSAKNQDCLDLLISIGQHHPNRALRALVQDNFMNDDFFSGKVQNGKWQTLVQHWIRSEKERMSDLVARITPSAQTGAASIFVWNENSEVEDKIFVLRRITFLVLVMPKDYFANVLEDLFGRLSAALSASCPPLYKAEAFTLVRAISIQFNEMHLLPYWTTIVENMVGVFEDVAAKTQQELASLPKDQTKLVFAASKLLDELLLVGFDEFNLREWLFVASDPGVVTGTLDKRSLIGRICEKTDSLHTKEAVVVVIHPDARLKNRPMLFGQKEVPNLASLRQFFGSCTFINYERIYGLQQVDWDACKEDVLEDLVV